MNAAAATTTKNRKPSMTADEAKAFDTFSEQNAATVETELAERRDCGCEPYVDVFTFGRWIAQGYVVRRGEKAIRIPVIVRKRQKNPDTGEIEVVNAGRRMVNVFCRHQVKRLDAK
jgi:hypothetical protein